MTEPDPILPEMRATVTPSAPRRIFAISTMAILGGLLLYIPMSQPMDSVLASVVLLAFGAFALYGADALRRATSVQLIFDGTDLRDSGGKLLASVAEVRSVERGAFAFKPSNGFLLRLEGPSARHWAPGLWWRLGRRVGVGGVTGAAETKAMAEAIALAVAARDGEGNVDPL